VAEPDLADHSRVRARVPHPPRHERIALGVHAVQDLGGQVAHPAVLPVLRKRAAERRHPRVRRGGVAGAFEQAGHLLLHVVEFLGRCVSADAPPDGRHVGAGDAERAKLGPALEGLAHDPALELQPLHVRLDAALLLGAGDQAFERELQLRSRKLEARAIELRDRHAQAATAALRWTMANAAMAAALPWAIESSIVSGPVAAPATSTPG